MSTMPRFKSTWYGIGIIAWPKEIPANEIINKTQNDPGYCYEQPSLKLLKQIKEAQPAIRIFLFEERSGKPGVVNRLVEESMGEILVITDANVMLHKNAIGEMIRYFAQPEIGLVDSRMINTRLKKDGISHQEKYYVSREVRIKHNESLIWGAMMGPFGGCYAVRKIF